MTKARIAAAAAVAVAVGAIAGLHPALHFGPVATVARDLADETTRGARWLSSLGAYDALAPWAVFALDASLLYIASWGFLMLTPRLQPREAASWIAPAAMVVGHLAGSIAAWRGVAISGFQCWMAGTAAIVLAAARFRWKPDAAPSASGPRRRLVPAAAIGLLLVLLASPIEAGFQSKLRVPLLPEAWFPIAVDFGVSGGWPLGLLTSALTGAVVLLMSERRTSIPAILLLLGASNPLKGLATAFLADRLDAAGGGRVARSAFVLLSIALFVVLTRALA